MKQYHSLSKSYRKGRYVVTVFQKDHYEDRIEYVFTSRQKAQDLYDKYNRFLITAFSDLKDNFSMITLKEYDF
jgi:hypothetical protein